MIKEMLLRIGIGGSMVTGFALLGDVIKPKRFAGLFGAAPSVALATLLLATKTQGKAYAATEARSMVGGAIAFLVILIQFIGYHFGTNSQLSQAHSP